MGPSKSSLCVAISLSLLSARTAQALPQATDGAVVVRYGPSHWDGSPEADLRGTEDDPNRDLVVESGWWLRMQGFDAGEVAFPAPDTEYPDTGNSVWTGRWTNLRGSGLTVYETVVAANGEGPSGTYVSRLSISNFGTAPVTFSVFHYLNPDADAGLHHESASAAASTPNMIRLDGAQAVPGGQFVLLGQLNYRAGGADARACRVDGAPLSLLLNDADADDLDGSGLPTPLTTAGVNCGYEWTNVTLNPSAAMYFVVSVSSNLPKLSVKGDYDSDNLPDLLLRVLDPPGGGIEIWGMRHTERRWILTTLPEGSLAVDDFDRDFENDLLYRNPATGIVYLFFRHSDMGPFGYTLQAPVLPLNWIVAATTDFDGDGAADILWRNLDSQKLVAWTMNGVVKTGNLIPTPDSAVDANWQLVGANDMNNDGHPDFIWYNATSGNVVVWYLDGSLVRTTGAFTTPASAGGAGWRLMASGDFGRGTGSELPAVPNAIDLIWQNSLSGRLVIWHMNSAAARTSGAFLTPDSAPGHEVIGPR